MSIAPPDAKAVYACTRTIIPLTPKPRVTLAKSGGEAKLLTKTVWYLVPMANASKSGWRLCRRRGLMRKGFFFLRELSLRI